MRGQDIQLECLRITRKTQTYRSEFRDFVNT